EARSVLAALRERAAATEAECRRLEQDHRDLQERIAAAEQRASDMDGRREELLREMAEAERLLAESLTSRERVSAESAVAEDRAQDLSGLEGQIQEMRDRLERMGPVNVLAVEQSQELEERSTFLSAQRQDLLDSIAELDQAIKKIDKASRERFQEAFQVINQH